MSSVHIPSFSRVKQRSLVQCSCGWNGGKHLSNELATMAWAKHVEQARA